MKLFYLAILFLCCTVPAPKSKTISFKLDFEVVEKRILKTDTIYICKDKMRVRVGKDSVYVYGKNQYFKFKK